MGLLIFHSTPWQGLSLFEKPHLLWNPLPSKFRKLRGQGLDHPCHWRVTAVDRGDTWPSKESQCTGLFGENLPEKGSLHQRWKGARAMIWWRKCEAILGVRNFLWKGSNIEKMNRQIMLGSKAGASGYIDWKHRSDARETGWSESVKGTSWSLALLLKTTAWRQGAQYSKEKPTPFKSQLTSSKRFSPC